MEPNDQKVLEFDIRGQICPSTLLIALREMNNHRERLRKGALRLIFRTDNRDSTVTIPDAAGNMGYGAAVAKEGDHYRIEVEGGR